MKTLFLIPIIIFICLSDAHALRQYRCDGRVQYYPCDETLFPTVNPSSNTSSLSRARPQLKLPAGNGSARVIEQNFEDVGNGEGLWRGRIEGQGLIHLRLYIIRSGQIETIKYMGSVSLDGGSTYYAFKSSLPSGAGWQAIVHASVS